MSNVITEREAWEHGVADRSRSAVRRSSPYQSWEHRPLDRAWHRGWSAEHDRIAAEAAADGQKKGNPDAS